MTRTPKTPECITSRDNKRLAESIKDLALSVDIPLQLRIEQASKPLYLTRYE